MRFALAVSLLLSAAAAHAESRYQLEAGFVAHPGYSWQTSSILAPTISIGVEDGASVWLLGIAGYAIHGHELTGIGSSNGALAYQLDNVTTVSVSLTPGYRRYLTGFESGFAPLLEGSLEIGVAHTSTEANPYRLTALAVAGNAGFGGEARIGDHFAIDARVFARLAGSRGSGSYPTVYSVDFGFGTSAGLTLRF
jgi:hypothetical protein